MKMQRAHSRGFTLIELMIALIIGLLMIGGLIQVFLGNRAAYRVMEGAGFMQENMRFSVDRIELSMRFADHWAGVQRKNIRGVTSSTSACSAAWAKDVNNGGMVGYDVTTTLPSALSGCSSILSTANYEPNTDVVVLRYAGPDVIPPAAALTSSQTYVLTATGDDFGIMYAGSSPPGAAGTAGSNARQFLSFQYNAEMFWIRKCSDPGTDGNCGTADDGDTPIAIPTLMRSYLDSAGTWTSEAVAEGMEQLQFEYQVMNRQWINATAAALLVPIGGGTAWGQITGARITGVVRSSQRDPSFPNDTRTFNLSGDTTAYTPAVAAQKYLRQAFEANVVLRNRVRPAPSI